jgi:ferredoxin
MAYKINSKKCLRCGLCAVECPQKAVVVDERAVEKDGLVRYTTRIDAKKCNDCGICVSFEWWCPAKAIIKG